jgi:hypothetical protein
MEQPDNTKDQSDKRYRTGKVEQLIDEYELTETGDELVHSWTDDGDERQSLRELAEQFNRQLLRTTIDEAGLGPHRYDVGQTYRLLTTDEVSSGRRTRIRRRLEQDGVDVEQLEANFVSHLAIRTYLRHRGATRSETGDDQVTKETQRIQRLQNRATTVTESKLDHLRTTDRIAVGNYRVLTEIHVFCEECETRYDVNELLSQKSCACFADN